MISYRDTLTDVTPDMLRGFFAGWPDPPSPERHLDILSGSSLAVLAHDDNLKRIVGFVTALTDGHLSAFVPLLEVLPSHQRMGIGSELIRRILDRLRTLYSIDLLCDAELIPFYERFGMSRMTGMGIRNYDRQSAEP